MVIKVGTQECHAFNKLCGLKMKKVEIEDLLNASKNRCYLSKIGTNMDLNGNTLTDATATYMCVYPKEIEMLDGQQLYVWLHVKVHNVIGENDYFHIAKI